MFNNVPVNGWPQLKGLEGGGDVSELTERVSDLETTVGDSESGLVKDVTDLQTAVGDSDSGLVKDVSDLDTAVDSLETAVGDSESGLVKDVADLQDANKYLTTETLVGKWGSANLYRKYINIGALPNSTTASYNTGLTTETVRRMEFYYDSDSEFGAIWSDLGSISYNKSTKKVDVSVTSNMSSYSGIIIIEYTK